MNNTSRNRGNIEIGFSLCTKAIFAESSVKGGGSADVSFFSSGFSKYLA